MGKGRQRNHEIPRFLLNRFATRVEGKKRWVWRIGRDGSVRELSTRDVAVSPRFYEAGVEDALQIAEDRFAPVLAAIDGGLPAEKYSEELRQLIWTLAVRTRAMREQFAAAADGLLSEFSAFGATEEAGDQLVRQLRSSLDERVEEAVAKLPLEQRRLAVALIGVPAVRERVLDYVRASFGLWADVVVRRVQDQGIVQSSARTGQLRGLAKLLDRGTPPKAFTPMAWKVIPADRHSFVLGDGCVFAKLEDGSYGSLLRSVKDWKEAYLPISDHQVLLATRERAQSQSLSNALINEASAAFSLAYIYASSAGPTARDLMPLIGTREPILGRDELAQLVKESLMNVNPGRG